MNSYQPISNAFLAYENQVELINFMDEGVLYELRKTNQITNRMVVRLAELAWKAVETGVDGILFTCSSFTPYVDKIAQLIPVPVLSSDISMLNLAVETGEKIGVIATIDVAGPTTKRMLEKVGAKKGKEIAIKIYSLLDAFVALQNGKQDVHDQMILRKIENIYESYDVILLAQYSMARVYELLPERFGEKVVVGPVVSAQAIVEQAKKFVSRGD